MMQQKRNMLFFYKTLLYTYIIQIKFVCANKLVIYLCLSLQTVYCFKKIIFCTEYLQIHRSFVKQTKICATRVRGFCCKYI